jgi:UDP-glucuronate decarboxylase
VSNFIVQALRGQEITLYGEGLQTRSFCYVDDLLEGFLKFMALPSDGEKGLGFPGPINLGNPVEFTIRQLAELVIDLTGTKSQLVFRPLPADDPMQRQPNIDRARKLLQWSPKVDLADGLGKTIRYFDELLNRADL